MTLRFNLTGKARTKLAKAISQELNTEATYIKGKTHAYIIGDYTLDKEGILTGPDNRELAADLQGLHSFVPASADYTENEENEAEDAPAFEELPLTHEEELGLGKQRREDPQGESGPMPSDLPDTEDADEAEETLDDTPEPPLVHPASPLETLEEPEQRIYRAELSDPDIADRMEVFREDNDFEAVKTAYEFCTEGVHLLELHELDEEYNEVRHIDLEASKPRLTIQMPLDGFNPEKLDNLCRMVTAKEALLKAALGVSELPIQVTEEGIRFPWFWSADFLQDTEREAYTTLISLLCETAREKKRVTAKVGEMPDNPKYAFRCFLLSLGMIGKEYSTSRKVLLSKLEGNSAWKDGSKAKAEAPATTEPAEIAAEA